MNNKLGTYIKEKYKNLGMTQIKFSQACDLSVCTIRNIEKGKTKTIPMDTYHSLAKGLNMSTGQLLKEINEISVIDETLLSKNESIEFFEVISPFLMKCNNNLNELTLEQKLNDANEIIHFIHILSQKY